MQTETKAYVIDIDPEGHCNIVNIVERQPRMFVLLDWRNNCLNALCLHIEAAALLNDQMMKEGVNRVWVEAGEA